MSMSDPLADMLTRIRNGGIVKFETVDMPHSKIKAGVAEILKREGYISDYQVVGDQTKKVLRVVMKYDGHNARVITDLKRISKPGRRVYVRYDEIPKVMSGYGISIISSSKGVVTEKEARAMKVGGELLCQVW